MQKSLAFLAVAAGLVLLAACGTSHSASSTPSATPEGVVPPVSSLVSATPAALAPAKQFTVLLASGSIQPAVLGLPPQGAVRLEITDTGPACLFSVGNYVRNLFVQQGVVSEVAFEVGGAGATPSPAGTATATGSATPATSVTALPATTMGCSGDSTRQGQVSSAANTPSQSGAESIAKPATPDAGVRQIALALGPNGVQPSQVDLSYNEGVHVTVVNQAAACRFSFGQYLQDLSIPANGSGDFTFTAANRVSAGPASSPGQAQTAGCAGDAARQVRLVLPPASAATGATPPPTGTPSATAGPG